MKLPILCLLGQCSAAAPQSPASLGARAPWRAQRGLCSCRRFQDTASSSASCSFALCSWKPAGLMAACRRLTACRLQTQACSGQQDAVARWHIHRLAMAAYARRRSLGCGHQELAALESQPGCGTSAVLLQISTPSAQHKAHRRGRRRKRVCFAALSSPGEGDHQHGMAVANQLWPSQIT